MAAPKSTTNTLTQDENLEILIIGATKDHHQTLHEILSEANFSVTWLPDHEAAMQVLQTKIYQLILLNAELATMSSYALCEALIVQTAFKTPPIIFLSQSLETLDKARAYDSGGIDFITQPYEAREVLARIRSHVPPTQQAYREPHYNQERKHYQIILETMQDGYYECDLAGNQTYANRAWCQILGYEEDEIIGLNNREFMESEEAERVYQSFNQVYRTGIPTKTFDWEIIRKDGSKRIIEVSINLKKLDHADKPVGFFGIIRDVTPRLKIEQALRESQTKYRNILGSLQEGYYESDLAGNLTDFNMQTCDMLGYSPDELIGLNFRSFCDDESAQAMLVAATEVFETGTPKTIFDWKVIRKDGTHRLFEMSISLTHDKNDKTTGFWGVVRDMTERRIMEQAVRENEEKYRTILESIQEAYFETDPNGNFTFFNLAACGMLGFSPREMMGMSYNRYTDEETSKWIMNVIREVYDTGIPKSLVNYQIIRKDGSKRSLETSLSLMYDANGQRIGIRGISRDITERQAAEQQRLNLAIEKERVQILTSFIQKASHEFRTPLATIKTNIYLLDKHLDQDHQPRLQRMETEIDNITRLVDDLVMMTSLDSDTDIQLERLNLNTFLPSIVDEMQAMVKKNNQTIHLSLFDGLDYVNAHINHLWLAIKNIIHNASRYTPREGEIHIRTTMDEDFVIVEVRDTGIGIEAEHIDHIFERFYRVNQAHTTRGFGLGLSIALKIIQNHHGHIDVESQPNAGSTFKICLPTADHL